MRWAACMSVVAPCGRVCVCVCVCWLLCLLAVQRSDIDYKVVAWGAAFAVEVAQNGSRR